MLQIQDGRQNGCQNIIFPLNALKGNFTTEKAVEMILLATANIYQKYIQIGVQNGRKNRIFNKTTVLLLKCIKVAFKTQFIPI